MYAVESAAVVPSLKCAILWPLPPGKMRTFSSSPAAKPRYPVNSPLPSIHALESLPAEFLLKSILLLLLESFWRFIPYKAGEIWSCANCGTPLPILTLPSSAMRSLSITE